ncbi:MAG: hypothetical protein M1825_002737 [Sarcosagium campestre]|nr:MAG: hypothetical protein M1825_002737 [Sarcosagium campestre]
MAPARYESENVDPAPLGQPLKFEFSSTTAKNRFLKAAMTERLSSWDPQDLEARGVPSDALINVYKRWGEGGFGVILTGNVMLEYDQLEAAGNPIVPRGSPFSGPRFDAFVKLGQAAKAHGSLIVAQLSHPGRQCESRIQADPISASDKQLEGNVMGMTFNKPHAASQQEIDDVVDGFAHAAEFLHKAGYDGVELHGAHGYLLSQFLSPSTNQRTDKYGGSAENRARIIVEATRAIRARVPPSFILSIKINSVEFQDKGTGAAEARELCKLLEAERFDFVELSGGTYEELAFSHKRDSTRKREAFFLDFADEITPALSKTKTYVTGGLRSAGAMVKALNTVDGVGIARAACQEFDLPLRILDGSVKAGIKSELDTDNFGLTNVAAGTQIRQVGKDQRPLDLSDKQAVDAFTKDMGTWAEKMGKDSEFKSYGYVDLSAPAAPYADASA